MRYVLAALCFAMGGLVAYGVLEDNDLALIAGIVFAVAAIAFDLGNERRQRSSR